MKSALTLCSVEHKREEGLWVRAGEEGRMANVENGRIEATQGTRDCSSPSFLCVISLGSKRNFHGHVCVRSPFPSLSLSPFFLSFSSYFSSLFACFIFVLSIFHPGPLPPFFALFHPFRAITNRNSERSAAESGQRGENTWTY